MTFRGYSLLFAIVSLGRSFSYANIFFSLFFFCCCFLGWCRENLLRPQAGCLGMFGRCENARKTSLCLNNKFDFITVFIAIVEQFKRDFGINYDYFTVCFVPKAGHFHCSCVIFPPSRLL